MTLQFRLRLAWVYIWGFLTRGTPIYFRDHNDTYIKLARWKYDPWTDTRTLVTKHLGERELHPNGTVDNYSSTKWRYVNKNLRTIQTLQQD